MNRGQVPANPLSVKSDLVGGNLIRENMKKRFARFITLSDSKLARLGL